jgi:exopolysaccharide biosynthesis predicted pyruvyltransferase EpsI
MITELTRPDEHLHELEAGRRRLLGAIDGARDVTFIRLHGNIGDDLIYAGARQLLSSTDYREISVTHVQGASGDTAIIAGGGGWCGVYNDIPRYLPIVEKRFRRVIVFPSSFDCSIPSVREAIAATNATVFARERESYRQIEPLCDAMLAFDTAFYFDYRPYMRRGDGTLVAYRSDPEAIGYDLPAGNNDISSTSESLDEFLWTIARHATVLTDRAHVMIAAALLGRRVEYRSSNYHKVPSIAEYALAGFDVTRREVDASSARVSKRTRKASAAYDERMWSRRSVIDIAALVPPEESFILVDDDQLRYLLGPQTTAHHFLERDGEYWGAPPDDESAIRELEAMRDAGVRTIVFAWPSFWWLEHYASFAEHLRIHYREALRNERLVAFDLTGTPDRSTSLDAAALNLDSTR